MSKQGRAELDFPPKFYDNFPNPFPVQSTTTQNYVSGAMGFNVNGGILSKPCGHQECGSGILRDCRGVDLHGTCHRMSHNDI